MASIGTQTTRYESGDNRHIAQLPNTLRPPSAPIVTAGGGGGITIITRSP